jgi:tetratricopeptide (TPR) repeat protein/predicted Ser/Thr protein kinase
MLWPRKRERPAPAAIERSRLSVVRPGDVATPCPTDDVLGALIHRALEPDEVDRLTAHIDDCVSCQQVMVAALRGGVAAAPPGDAPEPITRSVPGEPVDLRIGRYELRSVLGVGGMGWVYAAHDVELDRAVALKVLRPELGSTAGFADRLVHESRLMARITHPSVIAVYDVGREGDRLFIAMELIRGATLAVWLRSHALDWRAVLSLFERAGHGLAAAHSAGIVHRDFKPENVLVTHDADKVVVTDFGIAREAIRTASFDDAPTADGALPPRVANLRLTTDGALLGTPAYMAPEQIAGHAVDLRADVFAFSVSLWEALFGARPFPGKTVTEIFAAMRERPPRPVSGARRVPRRLVRALRKGLAVEPGDRWPDMASLLGELATVRTARKRITVAAAALGLVGVGVAAALIANRPAPAVDPCAAARSLLDEAYNPRLEAQVRSALAGDPKVQRAALTTLSEAATAWQTTHLATCHADRKIAQDAPIAACLDARRTELAGTVDDLITSGAAAVSYATWISERLAPPSACAEPAPGLLFARVPADRELRRKVAALRARLTPIRAAFYRADFSQALAGVEPIVADAATVWPPVHAEALYWRGVSQKRIGDTKLAPATLLETAGIAERAHHDAIAATAWSELVTSATFDEGDATRGLEYASNAEAAAERIGQPSDLMIKIEYVKGTTLLGLHRNAEAEIALHKMVELADASHNPERIARASQALGILYAGQARYRDAVAAYRRALEQLEKSPVVDPAAKPLYLERLAANLSSLGQLREAETTAREAVELADRTLPETQQRRPATHLALGQVLADLGRDDDALVELTGVVDVMARTRGKRSERYAEALAAQGDVLVHKRRFAQAEPVLARACDILAFGHPGDDEDIVAGCERTHSTALAGLHREAEALAKLDAALPALVKANSDAHPEVAHTLLIRGTVHASLGHHQQAVADLSRAIEIFGKSELEPGYLAAAQWARGKELWGGEPARARADIEAAVALFKTGAGRWSRQRDDATAWLARHPAAR